MAEGPATGAVLSLSVLRLDNKHEHFPERCIFLGRANSSISIGRASKVQSKGLMPSQDNAWFDSAVMSREHAEISVDFNSRTVKLRELGSLHGTFVNREIRSLAKNETRVLSIGDRVRFGVRIMRNGDTFEPIEIIFDVDYLFGDEGSTFAVPEASDAECDSDDCRETTEPPSAAAERQPPSTFADEFGAYPLGEVIDLTLPDSASQVGRFADRLNSRNRTVDLTWSRAMSPAVGNESQAGLAFVQLLGAPCPARYVQSDAESGLVSLSVHGEHNSDDGDEISIEIGSRSRSPGRSRCRCGSPSYGRNDSGSPSRSRSDSRSDSDFNSDYNSGANSIDIDTCDYRELEVDSFIDDDSDGLGFGAEYSSDGGAVDEDDPDAMTWNNDTPAEESEPVAAEHSTESETRRRAGQGASVDDDKASEATTAKAATVEEATTAEATTAEAEAPQPVQDSQMPAYQMVATRLDLPSILNPAVDTKNESMDSCAARQGLAHVERETSGHAPGASSGEENMPTACTPSNPPSELALLRDGSESPDKPPEQGSCRQAQDCPTPGYGYLAPYSLMYSNIFKRRTHGPQQDNPQPRTPSVSGVGDVSGDGTFGAWAEETDKQRGPASNGGHARRTHVGISDIIHGRLQPRPDLSCALGGNRKRKADDISELDEADREWAGEKSAERLHLGSADMVRPSAFVMSGALVDASPPCPAPASLSVEPRLASGSQGDAKMVSPVSSSAEVPIRPQKRMRIRGIAEKMGYAALGGATVGAAIMTTLICTAPSFT